jgi:hypothetical protein
MYKFYLNKIELESSKIDQSSIFFKVSTEITRFHPKASMLRFKSNTKINLLDKLNIIEVYKSGSRKWIGFVDVSTYEYDKGQNQTKFTCYDLLKKLPEIWSTGFEAQKLLGFTVEEILETVIVGLNYYLQQETGLSFGLNYIEQTQESNQFTIPLTALDENGTRYNVENRSNNPTVVTGLRFSFDEDARIGIFSEACTVQYTDNNRYYFGVVDGGFAYYFSNLDGERELFETTANYASPLFYEIVKNQEILVYWWFRQDANTVKFKCTSIGWNGTRATTFFKTVSTDWSLSSYPVKKLIYNAGTWDVVDGEAKEIQAFENGQGYTYSTESTVAQLYYEGSLSRFFRFPYWYQTTDNFEPNLMRVLNDLAVFFDGFYTLEEGTLRFYTESSCSSLEISDFKSFKMQGTHDLEYDLSDNFHPNFIEYSNQLETYYQNQYGSRYRSYSMEVPESHALNIRTKINDCRIVDLQNKKGIWKIKAIKGIL